MGLAQVLRMDHTNTQHTKDKQIPKAFRGEGIQLVLGVLQLFILHSWKTRSLGLHNTATSEKGRGIGWGGGAVAAARSTSNSQTLTLSSRTQVLPASVNAILQ